MSVREIRLSPDGDAIAIRGDRPVDSTDAYGVMHVSNGGAWASLTEVEDWIIISEGE